MHLQKSVCRDILSFRAFPSLVHCHRRDVPRPEQLPIELPRALSGGEAPGKTTARSSTTVRIPQYSYSCSQARVSSSSRTYPSLPSGLASICMRALQVATFQPGLLICSGRAALMPNIRPVSPPTEDGSARAPGGMRMEVLSQLAASRSNFCTEGFLIPILQVTTEQCLLLRDSCA